MTFPEKVAQNDIHLAAVDPVFWRSSIIRLLVSFDTSSIFNATELDEVALDTALLLMILLLWLYFSVSRSRTDVGMITDDLRPSSYEVGTVDLKILLKLTKI